MCGDEALFIKAVRHIWVAAVKFDMRRHFGEGEGKIEQALGIGRQFAHGKFVYMCQNLGQQRYHRIVEYLQGFGA